MRKKTFPGMAEVKKSYWFCPQTIRPLSFSTQPAFWMNVPRPWLWSWPAPSLWGLSASLLRTLIVTWIHRLLTIVSLHEPGSVLAEGSWVSSLWEIIKENLLFFFFPWLTFSPSWWAANSNDFRSLNRVLGVKEACLNRVFKRYNRIRLLLARKTSNRWD